MNEGRAPGFEGPVDAGSCEEVPGLWSAPDIVKGPVAWSFEGIEGFDRLGLLNNPEDCELGP